MNEIAVLISTYYKDKLKYLREALRSIYNQTFKQFDIYVYIDGSIPQINYDFLMEEYKSSRIYYLQRGDRNIGLACSLNRLLRVVLKKNYKYIARMDADDLADKRRFELQYNFMESNPDIDVCGTYIEEFGEGLRYRKLVKFPLNHEEMFHFFKKRVPIAHMTAFFRKQFFDKVGYYTCSTLSNEDTLLWMHGFKAGCKFANLPYVGMYVRINREFFHRRGGLKKALSDLRDRLLVIKKLNYPIDSYLYAFGYFGMQLLPYNLKKAAYLKLR